MVSRRWFLAMTGATGLAVACAPSAPSSASHGVEPKRGGELVVVGIGAGPLIDGYDPHGIAGRNSTCEVPFSAMYESLTEMKPDATVAPVLAESWTVSTDGKTYTFKMRGGVKFHNGREMTAKDVQYSLQRIQDPATNHPLRSQYAVIGGIDATDPSTVVMTLPQPYAPLPAILSDVRSSIVPSEEVAKGNFDASPVGTGPFRFVESKLDQYLLLEAFKGYWRPGLPRLDRFRGVVTPDANAAAAQLSAGQADFIRQAAEENFNAFKGDSRLDVYGGKGDQLFAWLGLNDKKFEPFRDVRVRQAINWAIDRDQIANLANPGLAIPLRAGFLPAGHWAELKQPVYPNADPIKAKQLLAAAGYPSGFKLTLFTANTVPHFPRAAQVVQQQLKQVGIMVDIVVNPPGQNVLQMGDWQAYLWGTAGTADPDQQFFATYMPGGGRNYTKYEDATLADLVNAARVSMDLPERARLYQDAQRRVAEVGPLVLLYNYNIIDVAQKYVKGYILNRTSLHWRELREVWLDK